MVVPLKFFRKGRKFRNIEELLNNYLPKAHQLMKSFENSGISPAEDDVKKDIVTGESHILEQCYPFDENLYISSLTTGGYNSKSFKPRMSFSWFLRRMAQHEQGKPFLYRMLKDVVDTINIYDKKGYYHEETDIRNCTYPIALMFLVEHLPKYVNLDSKTNI